VNSRGVGGLVVAFVIAADQASKAAVLSGFGGEPIALVPLLNLTMRRNAGISFSLFSQSSDLARLGLLAFIGLAVVALAIWLWRASSSVVAAGVGAILGGALGNLVDRGLRGAVVDFLDLHLGGWHFFVFNLADAAITLGVVLLALEAFLSQSGRAEASVQRPRGEAGRT